MSSLQKLEKLLKKDWGGVQRLENLEGFFGISVIVPCELTFDFHQLEKEQAKSCTCHIGFTVSEF